MQLNFKKYGTGKPLIILHGFLGSLDNWHTLSTEWGMDGLEVYTLDLRNHGRSPHTEEHNMPLMVEDLKEFMDQQGLASANILGHSMGGKVAMQFALDYPDKVDRLIIADMAPRSYKRTHDEVFKAISNVNLDKVSTRRMADEAMQEFLGDFGTRQFVLKSIYRDEATGKYQWRFNLDTLYKDYETLLQQIGPHGSYTGPVLFLRGSLSLYIKESDREAIMNLFPKARIQTIEHAGHWVHADKPKEFFDAVLGFIKL